MRDPVILALDHRDPDAARALLDRMGETARRVKIGSVLFTRAGPGFVNEAVESRGLDVFLDLKFHDTPATVEGAVEAAASLGVGLVTVHASGGAGMIEAAREAAGKAASPPRLLAVTVLTSLDAAAWRAVTGPRGRPIEEAVPALARAAIEAGADGIVCSAREARSVRHAIGPDPLVVVPGIRPTWSLSGHAGQVRTATPIDALAAGASDLVIGRAVTTADDPVAAIGRVRDEVARAGGPSEGTP